MSGFERTTSVPPKPAAHVAERRARARSSGAGSAALPLPFAPVSKAMLDRPSVEPTLQGIVELAAYTVAGAAAAGVSVLGSDGAIKTPAYTDERVLRVDRAQERYREGPCLAAAGRCRPALLMIDDMAAERRWPRFAAAAARIGVGSMVTCSLPLEHGGTAALNLHAYDARAFDESAAQAAAVYAAHFSAAVSQAFLVESLRAAMLSRQVIGEATGVLMERYRVDSREAFRMLVEASQRTNVKVRLVAEHVVRTGVDPQTIRVGDLVPGR